MRYTKIIKSVSSIGDMKKAQQRAMKKAELLVNSYKAKGIDAEIRCAGLYFFTYKVWVDHD